MTFRQCRRMPGSLSGTEQTAAPLEQVSCSISVGSAHPDSDASIRHFVTNADCFIWLYICLSEAHEQLMSLTLSGSLERVSG